MHTCTASATACAVITPPLIPLTKNVTCSSPLGVSSMLVMMISSADTNIVCLDS